jgi:hypothetical protein
MAIYGITDRCTGGTISAHSENGTNYDHLAFDDNNSTRWEGLAGASLPGYIRYQFASGVYWTISKLVYRRYTGITNGINAYQIQGSNNGSSWTTLKSGNFANSDGDQTLTFTNTIPYNYIQIYITSSYDGSLVSAEEISMYEGIYTKQAAIGSNPMIF